MTGPRPEQLLAGQPEWSWNRVGRHQWTELPTGTAARRAAAGTGSRNQVGRQRL